MKMEKALICMLLVHFSGTTVSETLLAGSVVCYGDEEMLGTYANSGEKEKKKLESHTCPVIAGEIEITVLAKKRVVVSEKNLSIAKIGVKNNYLKGAFDEVWTFEENIFESKRAFGQVEHE